MNSSKKNPKSLLSASILSADFAHLGEDVKKVLAAGADYIHFDVMDHHFVPNLSFGAVLCQALRKDGITTPIDVHLMVDNPLPYIKPFAAAGANLLTFHPETVRSVTDTIKEIHSTGMQAGLAFNPEKPIDITATDWDLINLILIMTVNPGFGGQSFQSECLSKVRATRARIDSSARNIILAVDGGVKVSNIGEIAQAGADFFVVGSGLFHADNYATRIQELRQAIQEKARV